MHRIRRITSERGAAAVEFALVLPLLLALAMGIIEFGRAYHTQIALTHAAREGARALALGESESEVRSIVLDAAASVPGVTVESASDFDCEAPSLLNAGEPASVSAHKDFEFLFFQFANLDLAGTGVMRCIG